MSTDRRPTGGVNDRENSAPWDGVDSKGSQPPEEYPRRRPVESDLLHDHSDDGRPDQQDQTTIEQASVTERIRERRRLRERQDAAKHTHSGAAYTHTHAKIDVGPGLQRNLSAKLEERNKSIKRFELQRELRGLSKNPEAHFHFNSAADAKANLRPEELAKWKRKQKLRATLGDLRAVGAFDITLKKTTQSQEIPWEAKSVRDDTKDDGERLVGENQKKQRSVSFNEDQGNASASSDVRVHEHYSRSHGKGSHDSFGDESDLSVHDEDLDFEDALGDAPVSRAVVLQVDQRDIMGRRESRRHRHDKYDTQHMEYRGEEHVDHQDHANKTVQENKASGDFVEVTINGRKRKVKKGPQQSDIDGLTDGVNGVQGGLAVFYYLSTGFMVGAAYIGDHFISNRDSPAHFLGFYSETASDVHASYHFVLSYACAYVSWMLWLEWTELHIAGKTRDFLTLFLWVCALLITLINVNIDDMMFWMYKQDSGWTRSSSAVREFEKDYLVDWISANQARYALVFIGWILATLKLFHFFVERGAFALHFVHNLDRPETNKYTLDNEGRPVARTLHARDNMYANGGDPNNPDHFHGLGPKNDTKMAVVTQRRGPGKLEDIQMSSRNYREGQV